MSSIDIQTTLLQADWRACLAVWTERAKRSESSWKRMLPWMRRFEVPASPDQAGIVLGPVTMRIDATGIGVRQGLLHVVHNWASVQEGTATAEHLFLWLDKSAVIIVPIRSLPAGMSRADFQAKLDDLHETAQRLPAAAARSAVQERRVPAAMAG